MTPPSLAEVRIAVADLDAAIEAWRASFGFAAVLTPTKGEALIEVGGCVLRFFEAVDATPGLAGLVLTLEAAGAGDRESEGGGRQSRGDVWTSHGVPVELVQGTA